jgi:hypothetical protein
MTIKLEEMYLPIDLESSLGRIEESQESQEVQRDTEMVECESSTRTCSQSPFQEDTFQDHQQFIPYPIAETDDEIIERQRLGASVGKFLPPPQSMPANETIQIDWVPEDLTPVEDPVDDDFSISTSAEDSLVAEDDCLDLEDIQDRVSFWDQADDENPIPPKLAPSVSFSSNADVSMA